MSRKTVIGVSVSILLVALFLLGALYETNRVCEGITMYLTNSGSAQPKNSGGEIFQLFDGSISKFVDGTDVTDDRFTDVVDQTAANKLKDFGVKRIVNKGGDFTVTLDAQRDEQLDSSVSLRLAKKIQFHLVKNGGKTVITNLTGVKVKVSILLGWMDVTDLTIEKLSSGNTAVQATISSWIKTFTYDVELDADGQPVT